MTLHTKKKSVVVLGSTGSVGKSTLDVIRHLHDDFTVLALAADSNVATLQEQIDEFCPSFASVNHQPEALRDCKLVDTSDPLKTLATLPEADIIVIATTGHKAIPATIAALEAGKIVALANKEAIVAAGNLVMQAASDSKNGALRPMDSEHSAIWQCLGDSQIGANVHRILLTASGGPFRDVPHERLNSVTPEEALDHPTWSMGAKITIDSATLMNKGFEVIEAAWLFNCPIDRIDVLIHPQSIVHSMVEFADGNVIAQMGSHDMRLPIQYALTYPDRPRGAASRLKIEDLAHLDFSVPDLDRFPALNLSTEAMKRGGTYPVVLSTSDEVAVHAFLNRRISFLDICAIIESALEAHDSTSTSPTFEEIASADAWTRDFVETFIATRS